MGGKEIALEQEDVLSLIETGAAIPTTLAGGYFNYPSAIFDPFMQAKLVRFGLTIFLENVSNRLLEAKIANLGIY